MNYAVSEKEDGATTKLLGRVAQEVQMVQVISLGRLVEVIRVAGWSGRSRWSR